MIEVQGLSKYYGPIAAIEDVTFHVGQGEVIGFLGPNGAGKTTTMRILTGFSPPSRGKATVAGFDIVEQPLEVKRRVGYLPETVPLYSEMVVSSFLRYVAEVKGIGRAQRRTEVGRVIERCGLENVQNRVIRNLSKGYRQRVGLAQALLNNPPVLILDEPTVGLDPTQIVEIRQMIRGLASEHTVLLSTHILPEVAMICERVMIIREGRIVAQDTMEHLAGGTGPGVMDVWAAGSPETVTRALGAVPGVVSVRAEAEGQYRVEGAGGAELGEPIARALAQAGLGLRELRRRTRTLEDVFMDAIASEERR